MKKLVAISLSLLMVFGLCACGEKTENSNNSNTEVEQSGTNNKTDKQKSELSFKNSFQVGGFKFFYPDTDLATVENNSTGYLIDEDSLYKAKITYQDGDKEKAYWELLVHMPYYDMNELKELNVTFDNIVDVCKDKLISEEFGAFRMGMFGNSNLAMKQVVKSSEKVTMNGIEMLKVLGTFENEQDGQEVNFNYIAYYMISTADDGTKIPVYYLGHGFNHEYSSTNKEYTSINDYYKDVEAFAEEAIQYTESAW